MKQEAKKTAVITGSGRGIGKQTAIILAKKSVNVVVCIYNFEYRFSNSAAQIK
jgi:NAD(P)-dependent dehydrogenase (short-subunit alcohol dehydrogenase family)